jgi:subtilisin family serine protease
VSANSFPPTPNDQGWQLRQTLAPVAWSIGVTGAGVRIGHLDTGITLHPELAGATILNGFDLITGRAGAIDPLVVVDPRDPGDIPGHGTATASVIISPGGVTPLPPPPLVRGGTTPPGVVTGMAQGVVLEPFRVISSVVLIRSGTVARGITRAVGTGCDVITMSLGGFPSIPLYVAVANAVIRNVIVVAAAGNFAPMVVFPAAFTECIAVAGTNVLGLPFIYSSRGPAVDIAAPAERVWVAWPRARVSASSGTSFAAPCVASIAALWLSANGGRAAVLAAKPPLLPLQSIFLDLLQKTAIPFPVPPPEPVSPFWLGPGIASAAAMAIARLPPPPPPPPHPATPGPSAAAALDTGEANRPQVNVGQAILSWLAQALFATNESTLDFLRASFMPTADAQHELDGIVDWYGLELLHIFMMAPQALEAVRAVARLLLEKGNEEVLSERVNAALNEIHKLASRRLSAALRSPA